MTGTLRGLLLQRAARLQERPALTAPGWGTLSYAQLRNRVEGVALGLLATERPVGSAVFSATGTPWDWAAELAAACSGLAWDPEGMPVPAEMLGGPGFNEERGRGPYHDREKAVEPSSRFAGTLDQETLLLRLQRLNRKLGWDHDSVVRIPADSIREAAARAALWSALYGGSHAILVPPAAPEKGLFARKEARDPRWDPSPFDGFWEP